MRIVIAMAGATLAACGPTQRHGDDGSGGGDGGGGGGVQRRHVHRQNACSSSLPGGGGQPVVGRLRVLRRRDMDGAPGPPYDSCYAVFVANVSTAPAKIAVDWGGQAIDLSKYAKLPAGTGQIDHGFSSVRSERADLAPGGVAILFLDYNLSSPFDLGNVPCPVPAALAAGVQVHGTGIGTAFHITTDTPVVAYQELPYWRRQGRGNRRVAAHPDHGVADQLHRGQRVG